MKERGVFVVFMYSLLTTLIMWVLRYKVNTKSVQWNGILSSRFIFLWTRTLRRRWNRYSGNKKRLSRVMFCLRYVMLISYHSAHFFLNPFWIRYSVNNKRLRTRETCSLLSCFVCYMYAIMAYFHPALPFQRVHKHACSLWRSFCVILINCEKSQIL